MLDELRTLFLAALFHSDTHSAIKLINEWNDACDRIQKVFDNMTDKNPNLEEIKHAYWVGDACSACGKRWDEDMTANADDWGYFDPMPPYCNNCGAKMDGVPNG